MRRTLAIGLLLLGCHGTLVDGEGGGGGAGVLDETDPILTVTSPERGTMTDAPSILVSGRAVDDGSGVGSLTLNGVAVPVEADGSFRADIALPAGLTLLETQLTDRGGNSVRDVRAVLAGASAGPDQIVASALVAKTAPDAFVLLGQVISRVVNELDLMSVIGDSRILDEGGSCLGVEVDLRSIEKSGATVSLTPQAGSLRVEAAVTGLHVNMDADFDVVCIGGSADIDISASRMTLSGDLILRAERDGLVVTANDLAVAFDDFNLNIGGIPGAIEDMIDGKVEDAASDAIEDALRDLIADEAAELLADFTARSWDVDVLDHVTHVSLHPSLVQIDATGATIGLESRIGVTGGEAARFVYTPAEPPPAVLGATQGVAIGLADDAVNQLLAGLWAAGALDTSFELEPDHPLRFLFGELPDRVDVKPKLPPMIVADEQGRLKLTVGDVLLHLVDTDQGQGETAVLAVSVAVGLTSSVTPEGRLSLVTNDPRVSSQLVSQTPAQDPPLTADTVDALGVTLGAQLTGLLDEALEVIPLPSPGAISITNASVDSGGGYLLVGATLMLTP